MAGWLLRNGRVEGASVDVRVREGRIVEVGAGLVGDDDGDDEAVVDLGGRVVVPGLRDAHVHATTWALQRRHEALNAALVAARSPAEAADAVAAAVAGRACAAAPAAPVIRGTGFRPATWESVPDAGVLDRAAPDRAVVLSSQDLHTSWWSSAALRVAGLDHPTGWLRERESWDALERLPAPTGDEVDAAIAAALDHAVARGVTTIVDYEISGCLHDWSLRAAHSGGGLPLHVVGGVTLAGLDAVLEAGTATGHVIAGGAIGAPGTLRVGALKLFADGALGSRTAWCDHAYVGDGDNTGMQLLGLDELVATLRRAATGSLASTVHAIGDAANRLVLDAFAAAGVEAGRIEHAQLLDPADVARFAGVGVTASVQPAHATDDRDLADRWWADRVDRAYPLATLVRAGARLVFGSDAPVTDMDPWRTIAAATARTTDDLPPWRPEQAISYDAALRASTATRIAPGEVADLCVLDEDPQRLSPRELVDLPVWATLVAGAPAHDPSGTFGEAP